MCVTASIYVTAYCDSLVFSTAVYRDEKLKVLNKAIVIPSILVRITVFTRLKIVF